SPPAWVHALQICLRPGALKKAIADADEQSFGRVRVFLRQSSFKVRSKKRRMRCKRFPKQGMPFIRKSDLGASAIALDIIPSDDALGFQAVQYAGQSTLGHQRGRREFRTGHSVCV